MRYLLVLIVALLLVPAASARADLQYQNGVVSGCGYIEDDVYLYFLWYPSGDPNGTATYTEEEVEVHEGCFTTTWTPPGDIGYVEIWAIQHNKAGKGYQKKAKITVWLPL